MEQSYEAYFPTDGFEKTLVQNIWKMTKPRKEMENGSVFPNGTVDIIFNFSETIHYHYGKASCRQVLPTVFICGARFKPIHQIATGQQNLIGLQLGSFGLKVLFDLSAKEFTDRILDGYLVCPELLLLAEALYHQDCFQAQTATIMQWVRKKMMRANGFSKMNEIVEIVSEKCRFDLTVKKLSHDINLSERQLLRFSDDWLGMKTEKYILYHKYLTALRLIHQPDLTLTEIALQSGYYDQSHFIREFKCFTELTPKQYQRLMTEVPEKVCF